MDQLGILSSYLVFEHVIQHIMALRSRPWDYILFTAAHNEFKEAEKVKGKFIDINLHAHYPDLTDCKDIPRAKWSSNTHFFLIP